MPQRNISEVVAGYPRVSNPGIPLDSGTVESQAKAIRTYCDVNNLTLLGMYPEAMTAYMKPFRERPVFMQVMDLARKGQIQAVVVTEYGRLARRQGEQAVIVELLRGYGVKVYSCTESFDDSALGQFMRAAAAFSAESEREKIVYRTTRGMRDRAESGNLTGRGYRTYGYAKANTQKYTNGRFIIIDEEAEIVVWMFARAEEGWSFRRIAITLTELGIPTMHGKPYWSYGTVATILRNPMYTGSRAKVFRYTKGENHSIRRPQEEQLSLPDGVVPQIISEDLFDRVQLQIARNKELSVRNNHYPEIGLLRGLVKCSLCGCNMMVHHQVEQLRSGSVVRSKYNCKKKTGNKKVDHCVTLQTHILDTQVWTKAVEHIKNPRLVRERVAELLAQNKREFDTTTIYAMLEKLRIRYRNLFDLAETAQDMDTYNELKGRLAGIEKEKRELEGMLKDEEGDREQSIEIEKELVRFEQWAKDVRPLLDNPGYSPTYADMRSAVLVLGLRAKVYPEGSKHRFEIMVAPPNIVSLVSQMSYSPV